jgi:lysozyme
MFSLLRRLLSPAASKLQAGVDVSSYQGPPGSWTGNAGKITWAAVKLTELEPGGTRYVNPDATTDWDWLKRNKKGRLAYLFGHPSVSTKDTVSFFVGELSKLGLHDSDSVALDLEVSDGRTPAQVNAWAVAVMADLEKNLGRQPVLYTFRDFAGEGNCASLGKYPLWIADPSSAAGKPKVPKPWRKWAIHQYDITGPIDRDVANFASQADMAAALGKPEEPDLKKIGGKIAGPVSAARWNTATVVAGIGTDGFVQAARWAVGGDWGPWHNVSPTKAKGGPSLMSWGDADGRLFYTDEAGAVCIMDTGDAGQTWT